MSITNVDVQAAVIAYTKTKSAVTSLLSTAEEIRELEWQGTIFDYPNVRVSVIVHPSINGCSPDRVEVFFDVFSDEKSSLIAQQIAGAIQTAYHREPFEQNSLKFSSVIVDRVGKADRTIFDWNSQVHVECLVN